MTEEDQIIALSRKYYEELKARTDQGEDKGDVLRSILRKEQIDEVLIPPILALAAAVQAFEFFQPSNIENVKPADLSYIQ